MNLGIRQGSAWIRLKVRNTTDQPVSWYLDLGDGLIESVTLHELSPDGTHTLRTTGTSHPWHTRDVPLHRIVFSLLEAPRSERELLIRISSGFGKKLLPRAYLPSELPRAAESDVAWASWLMGILAGVGAYHLILFVMLRDKAYFWHACLMFGLLTSKALLMSGGLESIWPEGTPHYTTINLMTNIVMAVSGLLFARSVMPMAELPAPWRRSLDAVLWGWLLLVLSLPWLSLPYGARAVVWLSMPSQLLVLSLAVTAWRKGSAVARWFLPAWLLLILGGLTWALRSAGWVPHNAWTMHSGLIGGACNALLMAAALALRVRNTTRERFEAQERLAQTQREANVLLEQRVHQRTLELSKAKDQAESANRHKDLFVRLVSHDLRSPLTSIMAGAQLMKTEPAAQSISATAQSLVKMIDRLLDIDYLSSGRLALRRTWVDARELVQRQCDQLAEWAREKDIQLHNQLPIGHPLFLDATLMGEVLGNLIGNAVKYCHPGDQVSLTLSHDGRMLSVIDTGPGFEAAARSPQGHGLGLQYVREILVAHGGELDIETSAQGTQITLHLPPAGPLVLLVDDQPYHRVVITDLLQESIPGCHVVQAENGREAMSALHDAKPDLVVSDIHMAEMDGYALARAIRQDPCWASVPVLLVSTVGAEVSAKEMLRGSLVAGADGFAAKPVNQQELKDWVRTSILTEHEA